MRFCQLNGHLLTFSLASSTRYWIFVQFGGSSDNKRLVEIDLGLSGSPISVDCGSHPTGHVETNNHDQSSTSSTISLFHSDDPCASSAVPTTPLTGGSELTNVEADNIKCSAWEFTVPGTGDTVQITVIIVNDIAED